MSYWMSSSDLKGKLRPTFSVCSGLFPAVNADMEAAQIIGAARSLVNTIDPECDGIPNDTPTTEAVKACYRHTKEAW
ncbi:hypothetical protein K438DRAFT_1984025 [Mycena galopus ATCC 62051]|nr:hypothetical protein K438DRAFT_1985685 [Mycena galopus ATCC 62051]KAF8166743.1 hypothetical protein K438DRAFT_1984025 [Mycena galopus ATCC 62051]